MSSPNYDTALEELATRTKAQIAAVKTSEGADDWEDALVKAKNVPGVFWLVEEESSDGRRVHNLKSQIEDLEITAIVVTESYVDKAGARTGNNTIRRALKIAIADFKPTGALKPLIFMASSFIARAQARVAYSVKFRTSFHNDYQA